MKKILIRSCLLTIPLIQSSVLQAAEPAAEMPEVEAKIVLGEEYQICHDVAAELEKHRTSYLGHCGIPIPTDNPDYELMKWETLDPLPNLELVKTIYYWANLGKEAGEAVVDRQVKNLMEIDPELLALYWPKVEDQMLEFMHSERFSLQHSRFDLDHDGVNEDVYRMTPAGRARSATPPQDQAVHELYTTSNCKNTGLLDADRSYVYYVPADQLKQTQTFPTPVIGIGTGFFKWRGRVYWEADGNIIEPNTTTSASGFVSLRKTQICSVQTSTKGTE